MIDQWEVDGDLVTLEEELGEGAFGKVYKGVVKELFTPSQKMSMMPSINAFRKNTVKQTGGFTAAVKMLHGELNCVLFWNQNMRLESENKGRRITQTLHQLQRYA